MNADAALFIPWTSEPPKRVVQAINSSGNPATRPKVRVATHDSRVQFSTSQNTPSFSPILALAPMVSHKAGHKVHNTESLSTHTGQSTVLDIMNKQNEITLLMQQQQLSSLPKRNIQVFDCGPLQYHSFMRAFENGIESKSDSYSDCLYFLEKFTRGRQRELVRCCLHVDPDRGYAQAKALLQEHFGNEQRISAA